MMEHMDFNMPPWAKASLLRFSGPRSYCSGVLITPDMALTAQHFLNKKVPNEISVSKPDYNGHIAGWIDIAGTDISVVKLATAVPEADTIMITDHRLRLGQRTYSIGHGNSTEPKPGLVVAQLPLAVSKGLKNRVRFAGVIAQKTPAVRGDSGGPVFNDNGLMAIQSMIFDPYGKNVGLATVAELGPHAGKIKDAMRRLQQHHA